MSESYSSEYEYYSDSDGSDAEPWRREGLFSSPSSGCVLRTWSGNTAKRPAATERGNQPKHPAVTVQPVRGNAAEQSAATVRGNAAKQPAFTMALGPQAGRIRWIREETAKAKQPAAKKRAKKSKVSIQASDDERNGKATKKQTPDDTKRARKFRAIAAEEREEAPKKARGNEHAAAREKKLGSKHAAAREKKPADTKQCLASVITRFADIDF